MRIEARAHPFVDDTNPVTISLGIYINLLEHVLLHLLQLVRVNSFLHLGNTLMQQTYGKFLFVRIHRTISLQHHTWLMISHIDTTISTTRVSSTLILTDGLQVNHGEYLSHSINLNGILQGAWHITIPNLESSSLRRLRLHFELVDNLTLRHDVDISIVLGSLTSSRQRCDILFNKWTNGLLVEVTREDKRKLSCILHAIFCHLKDTIVVDVLQILHINVDEA